MISTLSSLASIRILPLRRRYLTLTNSFKTIKSSTMCPPHQQVLAFLLISQITNLTSFSQCPLASSHLRGKSQTTSYQTKRAAQITLGTFSPLTRTRSLSLSQANLLPSRRNHFKNQWSLKQWRYPKFKQWTGKKITQTTIHWPYRIRNNKRKLLHHNSRLLRCGGTLSTMTLWQWVTQLPSCWEILWTWTYKATPRMASAVW